MGLNQIIIYGQAVQGLKESSSFTELSWVKEQFISKFGFTPHPGTFNLEIKDAGSLKSWQEVKRMKGVDILPREDGYCSARSYQMIVAERIKGVAVVPEVPEYPDSKMEIIAPCNIRKALGVTDGDLIRVEILVGMEISFPSRKEQHIRCCLKKDVESSMTTGFEKYYLINQSLPEMALGDVNISSTFLGKKILAPFIISPMTGGIELSTRINKNLARAAQELGVIMSVGSQRLAFEDPSLVSTYQVRDVAPDIPLLANIGASYLNYGIGPEECRQAAEMIGADGLVLYLNPLQKILQGGHSDFKNLIKKISRVCNELNLPVIVKEIGFGLSPSAAIMLRDAGVWALDIAGAGGTSWAKIERYMRNEDDPSNKVGNTFDDWGIPTANALVSILKVVRDIPILASGGIRTGLDMTKAIALGASYVGMALPLLAPAVESHEAVKKKIQGIIDEFKVAMFCCGKRNLEDLRKGDCIRKK